MAEQQALPSRPRNFSNYDIAEVIGSPSGKKDLFKDYRQLTPKAMDKYDKLVEQTGNQIVIQAHKEIKGLAQFSNNKAGLSGGALFGVLCLMNSLSSIFENNHVFGVQGGGAMFFQSLSKIVVDKTIILNRIEFYYC